MTLRDRIKGVSARGAADRLYDAFGIVANPFPASNQTSANPHRPTEADAEVESRIVTFLRDGRSQVVVVEGTQGVGKTNFLNHFEAEIRDAMSELDGYYMIRYLADPEPAFEGTTRRLFEELGTEHLERLRDSLGSDRKPIREARGHDMRTALRRLARSSDEDVLDLMMQWLLGLRVLKAHRQSLGVQFRLDTVESRTAALRDLIQVSAAAGVLKGVFLLLDELEKQDGVLGPTAVVRYLSAMRSVVDALPERLFLMIGITPDALRCVTRLSCRRFAAACRTRSRWSPSPIRTRHWSSLASTSVPLVARHGVSVTMTVATKTSRRKVKSSVASRNSSHAPSAPAIVGSRSAPSFTHCTTWRRRRSRRSTDRLERRAAGALRRHRTVP